jgi:hypothetical protein
MKKLLCALAISALAAPGFAFADGGNSCATAQEIFPASNYSGDTSTSTNWVGGFGGLPSPGPDLAFKFTSNGQATSPIVVTITGGWNAGAVITAACGGNAGNPVNAGTGTATISVPVATSANAPLTAGTTYYFYVTGNPSDNSGPSGAFSFVTPNPLPVTLKDFAID